MNFSPTHNLIADSQLKYLNQKESEMRFILNSYIFFERNGIDSTYIAQHNGIVSELIVKFCRNRARK